MLIKETGASACNLMVKINNKKNKLVEQDI